MPRELSNLSERHKRRILCKDVAKTRRTSIPNDIVDQIRIVEPKIQYWTV